MAKQVKMMVLDGCPHCRHAFELMDELRLEHPEYRDISVEVIEEEREAEKTQGYDYWYVPTFFVYGVKLHEGVPTKSKIERVFRQALER